MKPFVLVAGVASLVAGCSLSTDTSGSFSPPGPQPSVMTFSGVFNGTITGSASISGNPSVSPNFILTGPSVAMPPFLAGVQFLKPPTAGSYTETDSTVDASIVMSIGTQTWRAGSLAFRTQSTTPGSFVLVLSSVSPPVTYNGSVSYAFSGTIDAIMRTASDTSTIRLHATF
jgi:hypothetical protein